MSFIKRGERHESKVDGILTFVYCVAHKELVLLQP